MMGDRLNESQIDSHPFAGNETRIKDSMDPYQAAECLRAAARLMSAAWKYGSPDSWTIQTDLIEHALRIIATLPRDVDQYRGAV